MFVSEPGSRSGLTDNYITFSAHLIIATAGSLVAGTDEVSVSALPEETAGAGGHLATARARQVQSWVVLTQI